MKPVLCHISWTLYDVTGVLLVYLSYSYLVCRRLGLLFLEISADGTHSGSDYGSDSYAD